ncbi:MAG TPA: ATP-binding protein, partial [Prolixibacteraceae bacterium]|nr:ATP-binding protein [Prolixibacteraceae bacterium]
MNVTKLILGYILFTVLFIQSLNCSSANQERYLHFTEIDGLPRNITTCLAQDEYGYVWIGTNNGIAQYDGKDFNCYSELSGIGIIHLHYDSKKTLWVGTNQGLFKYNRITDFFELVVEGYISKIEEAHGTIYFLMVSVIYKIVDNKAVKVLAEDDISDFCISKEGLWISKSYDGVFLYNHQNDIKTVSSSYLKNKPAAQLCKIDDKLFVSLFNGQVFTIAENGLINEVNINNHFFLKKITKVGNEIWMATDGNGIIILDNELKFSRILGRNKSSNESINSNSIYDILIGKNNEIWLASFGAGLTCMLPDNLLFQNILPEKGNKNSLVANEGVSVFVKGPLSYFGTNYGFSEWDKDSKQFVNLSSEKLRSELNGTKVTAMSVDSDQNIWIGTYDGLLGKYNSNYQLIKKYHPCSNEANEMQQIVGLEDVSNNNMIILTQFHSQILLNFDKSTETATTFELYNKGSNITYCLLNSLRRNQQGELLAVISNMGLFNVNWNDNVLENKLTQLNAKLNCTITDFYQDRTGNYWITSSSDGLIVASPDGNFIKKWSVKNGLPSNTMLRIESTDDRYLWISTISGICRFDTKTSEIMNFNHRDGLPANEFHGMASASLPDGRIAFGSLAGFTIIDPSKLFIDTTYTEVIISDITFQNQSIRNPLKKQFLTEPLEETKKITLPYDKNSFSIHFFTKHKNLSKYNNYKYRLVGLEENWTYQGETNFTTYTNLSSGTYTFEIKSADKSQTSTTTKLTINIKAPWYLSWYAYLTYIILFSIILYLSIYAFLKRFELFKEKEIAEIRIQKEHELTEKKLAFFTNISHDLKTPLTLIDGPVNDLLNTENLTEEQTNKLQIIKRNSKRLYKLITDLIDFRLITQNQNALEVSETVINEVIKDCFEAFKEECEKESIKLKYKAVDNLVGFIDLSIIEKILWNLLSNALKFSNNEGVISIELEEMAIEGRKNLQLKVSDNGIGISAIDRSKIFDRFYKAHDSKKRNQQGTGIGLSIVKELVEIHHGKISVDSNLGEGTTFTILIPINKESYTENEIIIKYKISATDELKPSEKILSNSKKKRYNLPGILVVEDDRELRDYLAGHFEKNFKVYTAADGFDGLKLAKEINLDIILTDVQMPNMNGYDFCKEIRLNFETSHIPIVMVTANKTINQQIEGLSTGADIYLTKPFDIKLLDAQIYSLLENRKALRNKFYGIETLDNLEDILPQKDID